MQAKKIVNFTEKAFEQSLKPTKVIRKQPTRGDVKISTSEDGNKRLRMYKQKSSYLSDFECESDDEEKQAVREAFELDGFVGTVELDDGQT